MKSDTLYLERIADSIRKIRSFTKGLDARDFGKDEKTQSAVMLQLMLIGEMTKRVSEGTKASIDLPWKEITGFRDRAIHDYYDIDLEIVWQTIISDIPALKKALASKH